MNTDPLFQVGINDLLRNCNMIPVKWHSAWNNC